MCSECWFVKSHVDYCKTKLANLQGDFAEKYVWKNTAQINMSKHLNTRLLVNKQCNTRDITEYGYQVINHKFIIKKNS